MTWSGRATALLLAFSLAGCSSRRDESAAAVARIGAPRLAADAALLKKHTSPGAIVQIPQPSWFPALRELEPQEVSVGQTGVFVQRWRRFVEEEGVFIAFDGVTIDTSAAADPSFSSIADRVYWYTIKG